MPWISGNGVASFQPPSATSPARASWASEVSAVPELTEEEYHPSRVLISVLLTPAASTSISASPGPGSGNGTSR